MKKVIIDGIEFIENTNVNNPFVIIRGKYSGVHAGYLKEDLGNEVILNNSRRLWMWKGAASLSQLAVDGVNFPNVNFTKYKKKNQDLLK
jgi:hypothetical protein